ncbi:MAG: hypothetical protein HXS44_11860 [Theionarchaea archaeon]|nr:hypothetical protein [Theionarchaea archaeon]
MDPHAFRFISDWQHDSEILGEFSTRLHEVKHRMRQLASNVRNAVIERVAYRFILNESDPINIDEDPYWPISLNRLWKEIVETENLPELLTKAFCSRMPIIATVMWGNPEGNVANLLKGMRIREKERDAVLRCFDIKQLDRISLNLMRNAIKEEKLHRTFRVAESSLDRLPTPWELLHNFQIPARHGRIQVVLTSPEAACNVAQEESQNQKKMESWLQKEGFFQFEESLRLRAIQLLSASYAAMYYLLLWKPSLYSFQVTDMLPTFRGGTTYDEDTGQYENLVIDQVRRRGIGRSGTFRLIGDLEDIRIVTSELSGYPKPRKSSDELAPDMIFDLYPRLIKIEKETAEAIRDILPNPPRFRDDICEYFHRMIDFNRSITESERNSETSLKFFLHSLITPLQEVVKIQTRIINDRYQEYAQETGNENM